MRTITKEELAEILDKHTKWLREDDDGIRANLIDADLSGANLIDADLSGANLIDADLSGANLSGADLSGADLRHADLSGANLRHADLSGADLRHADLSGANLSGADLRQAVLNGTCIDDELLKAQRLFCRQCPPLATGGRIVYRTTTSQHVGHTHYEPGHTYTAPVLSFDAATACHPGIYAGSLKWMKENYRNTRLVVCYVRDGDWVITAKGAIRCKKLRVLSYYEE